MPLSASTAVSSALPICPTTVADDDELYATAVSGYVINYKPSMSNSKLNALRVKPRVRRRSQRRVTFRPTGVFVPFLISLLLLQLFSSIFKVYAVDDDQYTDNNNGYFNAADGDEASADNSYANFYDEYGNKLSYDGMSMMPISCIPL
jgi:hypothetical protein